MKILSLKTDRGNLIGLVYDSGGDILNLTEALSLYQKIKNRIDNFPEIKTVTELFREQLFNLELFKKVIDFVERHKLTDYLAVRSGFRYNAPVEFPPKILCLARNYPLHAKESGLSVPDEPVFFAKSSTALIGHMEIIQIPEDAGRIDHEVELAVVIGRKGKKIKKEDAWHYIAGYTIALDITAREIQKKDIQNNNPWFRSKSFDTFAPMGPHIVTADEIKPPVELDINLWVNDELRQSSNTKNMVFDIPSIIEYISKYISLVPGDVILTGTPEGIGPIKPGDRVVAEIQHVGRLINYVQSESEF